MRTLFCHFATEYNDRWRVDRCVFSDIVEFLSSTLVPRVDVIEIAKRICMDVCGISLAILLRPFSVLSTSEQHAVEVSKLLVQAEVEVKKIEMIRSFGNEVPKQKRITVIIDEFTSCMDRAKAMEFACSIIEQQTAKPSP